MTTIDQLIFLIHPCCYEALDEQTVRENNFGLFVERERQVKRRWLEAMGQQDGRTLLLQLYGPRTLLAAARERLGEANACYVSAEFAGPDHMQAYYRRLARCIHDHMRRFELSFAPATATSELWGESFEGCVAGYGGAFAEQLGLEQSPRMKFAMTVYDSRFLHDAQPPRVIPIGDSDIEAWVFVCHDGTSAAIFQARRTAQWRDGRAIQLELDPSRVQVQTCQGHTIWPAKPWRKGDAVAPEVYQLTTAEACWLRGVRVDPDAFQEIVERARVGEPPVTREATDSTQRGITPVSSTATPTE